MDPCNYLIVLLSSKCALAHRTVPRPPNNSPHPSYSAFVTWPHDFTSLVNLLLGSVPKHLYITYFVHCIRLNAQLWSTHLVLSHNIPCCVGYVSIPSNTFNTYQTPLSCLMHTHCSSWNTGHVFPFNYIRSGRIPGSVRFRPTVLTYVRLHQRGYTLTIFARDSAMSKSYYARVFVT